VFGTPRQLRARLLLRHERGSDVGDGRRFSSSSFAGLSKAPASAPAYGDEQVRGDVPVVSQNCCNYAPGAVRATA
jgi:hypothetical protein